MRASLSPLLNFEQRIPSVKSLIQRASYAEETDVPVNLNQTVDLARAWVEVVSDNQSNPEYECLAYAEAVLSATQLTWKLGSRCLTLAQDITLIAIVRELRHPPKSLQVVSAGGGLVNLAQAVDPNRAMFFRGCVSPYYTPYPNGGAGAYADHAYLASGSQVCITQSLHPRGTVVEFR